MQPVTQDWYALLGVAPAAGGQEIAVAVEKLGRQANALSVTMPPRARLLRDQIRAIRADLLSGDAQRRRYDQALAAARRQPPVMAPQVPDRAPGQQGWPGPYRPPAPQPAPAAPPQLAALVGRVARFLQTGWTCAACGYDALPNDKFCHKCGARIEAPARPPARPGPAQPGSGQAGAAQPGPVQPGPVQAGPVQAGPVQAAPVQAGTGAFCGKCGGPIAAGNTFCTQCGAQRA